MGEATWPRRGGTLILGHTCIDGPPHRETLIQRHSYIRDGPLYGFYSLNHLGPSTSNKKAKRFRAPAKLKAPTSRVTLMHWESRWAGRRIRSGLPLHIRIRTHTKFAPIGRWLPELFSNVSIFVRHRVQGILWAIPKYPRSYLIYSGGSLELSELPELFLKKKLNNTYVLLLLEFVLSRSFNPNSLSSGASAF